MNWKFIKELQLAHKYMGKCQSSLEVKDILSFFFLPMDLATFAVLAKMHQNWHFSYTACECINGYIFLEGSFTE